MKPTDFARHLTQFFSVWLVKHRNASSNTVCSYRDTFKLFLLYCQEQEGISPQNLTLSALDSARVHRFLHWLQTERSSSISTQNQRLAAIRSFCRYVQFEEPAALAPLQKTMAIPVKKTAPPMIDYLTPEAMKLILDQPDRHCSQGRRDVTLLSVLYDSAARVQELVDAKVMDVTLQSPAVLQLKGKGGKSRRVPLMKNTASLLENYLAENRLLTQHKSEYPLFVNRQRQALTREGVTYIVKKYAAMARMNSSVIPPKVTAHMYRHSKAMHLLQAGVNLIYIRDFLGHTEVKTTEIYARADTETKRRAIESAYPDLIDHQLPDWSKDQALLSWLSELK